ncbi:hypothetical protein AMC99_00196 [Altererythrobacter epoxidivorans]|uniref:Lipoprotein n=1 Tax=Altererythrobacter epoxidivorans TaxID=361183 RepID=A0A0M3T9L6_9SPHN|nr:hypothetical protein [Altererythrobacter epoxidivorans]ALE15512.1 hypothetical protein AMC99_00196 [Altererythrobacter epoxidivorans]
MNKLSIIAAAAGAMALGACSQETQDNIEQTAEYAADDAAKNLDAAGEVIEDDLADAAAGVSARADKVEDHLRDNDDPADEVEAAPAFNGN